MKKIVSSLALASILVSGLYAQQGGANCDFRKDGKNSPINQKDGKKMSKQNYGILGMFYELNLTADQKTKIDNIKNQELHADVIDKAYKVLDSKQKEQLRTLLDLRKEKMKQRFED